MQEAIPGRSGFRKKQNDALFISPGVCLHIPSFSGRTLTLPTVLECFQGVFYLLPPLFEATELQEPLACSEALWQAFSEAHWRELRRSESGITHH